MCSPFSKMPLTQNVAAAVARRGGFRELVSRDAGWSHRVGDQVPRKRRTARDLSIGHQRRTRTRHVVESEVLRYRRGQRGQPWRFVDFSKGEGTAITNEYAYGQEGATVERADYKLDDPSVLAIKGLGQFRDFPHSLRVSEPDRKLVHLQLSDRGCSSERRGRLRGASCLHAATTWHK